MNYSQKKQMFDFMLYFKRFQTVIPLSSLVFKNAFKQSHTKQILDIDLLIRKGKKRPTNENGIAVQE